MADYPRGMRKVLGLPAWLLRVSARGLLVALSVSALGAVAPEIHEDDCEPVVVLHDEGGHRGYGESPPFELRANSTLPASRRHVACR